MNLIFDQILTENNTFNTLNRAISKMKKIVIFEQQLKIFFIVQKIFEIRISKIRFATKLSTSMTRQQIQNAAKNDAFFTKILFILRIIIIILQQSDQLM